MIRKLFSPQWVLLAAIFVMAWTFNVVDEPLTDPRFQASAFLAGMLFCAIVLVFGQRNLKTANEGVALIQQGRHAEALALYEQLEKRWVRVATVRNNRSHALLGLWRIDEAHALQSAILERPLAGERTLHFLTRPEFALTCALMGDAEPAREIIRTSASTPVLLLASAVLSIRDGRFEEVDSLLGGREIVNLSGYHRALADALLDWSRLETGKRTSPTDHRNRLFGADGAGTLPPHWPELLATIDRLQSQNRPPAAAGA